MTSPVRSAMLALAVALAGCTLAGCTGGVTSMRPLPHVVGAHGGEEHFRRIVVALRSSGYEVRVLQPERLRVGVLTHYQDRWVEDYGTYRVGIVCGPHHCRIDPVGPRVEQGVSEWIVPDELRDELLRLQTMLESVDR